VSRVVVTGSIATDHLMSFPGRFADQLIADQLHTVSLSFLVDELIVRRGGVGANIAYGLAQLGLRPTLVGAVGADFADYRSWLERHHVDCSSVLVSERAQTARFICTTDQDMCQIASFYAGAMTEAVDIDLAAVPAAGEIPDLVVIAPDVPGAMLRHAAACRHAGWAFAADPSQQLARMSAADIAEFITGARYLLTNEYEYGLLRSKLGASDAHVRAMVGVVVTTRGAAGVRVSTADRAADVPAVPLATVVDPTGGGDAFRAGFIASVARGLSDETAAAVGCQLAVYAIQQAGGQEYEVRHPDLLADLEANYGEETAAAVREALRPAVVATGSPA
jgi:adenosine kinase